MPRARKVYAQIRQFYEQPIGLFIPGVLFNNDIGMAVSLNPLMLVLPVFLVILRDI